MYRIIFYGRGGQGAKVASRILGTAAFLEGYYAQDFPLYGAERRGAPISAFTRISKEPILERGIISEPDIIIIMDETLLVDSSASPLEGIKKGGIVFVNTLHSPDELKAQDSVAATFITLDITKIGLDILNKPVLSTLAGGVASKIAGLKEESLTKAVEKEISKIVTDQELISKNREAALHCFRLIEPVNISKETAVHTKSPVIEVPCEAAAVASPTIKAMGNTVQRKTGNWRVFKPVWDYDICTQCMICVARCPDGCISVGGDGFPHTDYDNCKGCMICFEECPVKAIQKKREEHN